MVGKKEEVSKGEGADNAVHLGTAAVAAAAASCRCCRDGCTVQQGKRGDREERVRQERLQGRRIQEVLPCVSESQSKDLVGLNGKEAESGGDRQGEREDQSGERRAKEENEREGGDDGNGCECVSPDACAVRVLAAALQCDVEAVEGTVRRMVGDAAPCVLCKRFGYAT